LNTNYNYKIVCLFLPHPQPFSKGEGSVGLFCNYNWYKLLKLFNDLDIIIKKTLPKNGRVIIEQKVKNIN